MELSELLDYARDTYQMEEQHKWSDFPGFSVLVHPQTGKWVALLMRQWDTDSGEEIQRCDLKCGIQCLREFSRPYLSPPLRMKAPKWIDIAFRRDTEPEIVFRLFDRAMADDTQAGFTMVLKNTDPFASESVYHDTPLSFPGRPPVKTPEVFPERLRQMKHLYEYGSTSLQSIAENFCRQGRFMADFEDEAPWPGGFTCYFPTYHDMTTRQLRGYFSWRTHARKGDFQRISFSAAQVYLFELINCIGVASPEEALVRMKDFETGYIRAGTDDIPLQSYLHRWMTEFIVVHGLPQDMARQFADPVIVRRDSALQALRSPSDATDEDLFQAFCLFDGDRLARSPVSGLPDGKGRHLFCEVWRHAMNDTPDAEPDLFTRCFGTPVTSSWYPFANAVYFWETIPEDRVYHLNPVRTYQCRNGAWQMTTYENLYFSRRLFHAFLRQTDLMLRRRLKTGHYLKEKSEDAWAAPYVLAVLAEEERTAAEQAKAKITLDLSGLEQIRQDALITRDSLLTEEEREDLEEADIPSPPDPGPEKIVPDLPLDDVQRRILQALLEGRSASAMIREAHLMPTMAADAINEQMFDLIGDTVVSCENDQLSLVEDYREDLLQMLGGTGK